MLDGGVWKQYKPQWAWAKGGLGVWKQYKPQWAKGGFCKCGIVPFKPESVPDSLFLYSDPFSNSQVSDESPTASDENSLVAVLQSETENEDQSGVQIVQMSGLTSPGPL